MKVKTEPCRNCSVPVYLDFTGAGEIGISTGGIAWVHLGHEDGAGCDDPAPRLGRRVEDLPGL